MSRSQTSACPEKAAASSWDFPSRSTSRPGQVETLSPHPADVIPGFAQNIKMVNRLSRAAPRPRPLSGGTRGVQSVRNRANRPPPPCFRWAITAEATATSRAVDPSWNRRRSGPNTPGAGPWPGAVEMHVSALGSDARGASVFGAGAGPRGTGLAWPLGAPHRLPEHGFTDRTFPESSQEVELFFFLSLDHTCHLFSRYIACQRDAWLKPHHHLPGN